LPIFSVMIDSSIVFLDSGIGGLPYLSWLRSRHPELSVTYIADSANFPYGVMSSVELKKTVVETVRTLLSLGVPRLLVVACNTASVTALDDIRAVVPCPVVGTVPAVKSAAGLKVGGPIGVLATSATIDSPYLDRLVSSFASGREIVKVAAGDIVRYVEERWLDEGDEGAVPVMEPAIKTLRDSGVGSVVLGCTHFLHLIQPIKKMVGNGVPLVDSRDGVGRRIIALLNENIKTENNSCGRGCFFVTKKKNDDKRYQRFAALYGLDWLGELL